MLAVPAASDKTVFFGSAIDSWEVPLADIGGTGDDAGQGGKYLFLPPGYDAKIPDGYCVVPSQTVFIHVGLRPIRRSRLRTVLSERQSNREYHQPGDGHDF